MSIINTFSHRSSFVDFDNVFVSMKPGGVNPKILFVNSISQRIIKIVLSSFEYLSDIGAEILFSVLFVWFHKRQINSSAA